MLQGFASDSSFNGRKSSFLFFLNQRAVDSSSLRRAIEAVYSSVLPKSAKHFVVLVSFCLCKYA